MFSVMFVIKTILVIGFFLFIYKYLIKLYEYIKSFRFYNNEVLDKIADIDGLQIIQNKDIRLLKLELENLMNQINELKNSTSLLNEKIDRYNRNTLFDLKNSNSLLNDKIDRQTKNTLIDIKNLINENQSAINLQMKDINNRIFKVEIQLK
jgi:predicted nuclease with TOPRIM domain